MRIDRDLNFKIRYSSQCCPQFRRSCDGTVTWRSKRGSFFSCIKSRTNESRVSIWGCRSIDHSLITRINAIWTQRGSRYGDAGEVVDLARAPGRPLFVDFRPRRLLSVYARPMASARLLGRLRDTAFPATPLIDHFYVSAARWENTREREKEDKARSGWTGGRCDSRFWARWSRAYAPPTTFDVSPTKVRTVLSHSFLRL